jgi:exopolysaccharide biosynthesis polyprenyl glycosylphosphotransferase
MPSLGVAATRRRSRGAPALPPSNGQPWRGAPVRAAIPPTLTFFAADVVAVSVASIVAHLLRFGLQVGATVPGADIPYVLIACVSVPTWLGVLALAGAYDRRVLGVGTEEYRRVLNGGVHFLAIVALLHFVFRLVFARGWVGVMIPVAVVLTLSCRYALRRWLYHQRARGRYIHRMLLVGSEPTVVDVGEHLARSSWSGFRVVGVCLDRGPVELKIAGELVPVVGSTSDVRAAIVACGADSVAITGETAPAELRELAEAVETPGVELLVAPAITDVAGPRTVVRNVAGVPLLHVEEPTFAGPQRVLKEAMDRVTAALGLLVLSPVFLALAIAIRLDTPGTIFFRQRRVGHGGRRFEIVKFRTMVEGAETLRNDLDEHNEADGVLFKVRADPRITRVGRVLRRWSIDELPQLWNVLRGEMSLVGPRPPLPAEVEQYEHHVSRRLLVKPGMTGLWQVSGRSDLQWDEAVRLDLFYVDHWSPIMDVAIICRTFAAVIRGSGAY